jgi:hypothetical protein
VSKSFDQSEKARQRILKALRDLDASAIALGDKKTSRIEFDRKVHASIEALTAYEPVANFCSYMQKEHFGNFLPTTISQVQKDDEQSRTLFIKTALQKYNELASAAFSNILGAHAEMGPLFDNINAQFDTDLFSKMMDCHSEPIGDVKMFENLVFNCWHSLIYRIKSVNGGDF